MEKLRKVISEIHLYKNKMEALIKVGIWIISWIGGILTLLRGGNKDALCNAYFIYMLSLLMEFVPKINEKKEIGSKLIHTLFCFMMVVVFLLSSSISFRMPLPNLGYRIMRNFTVALLAFMVIDTFILWIEPENNIVESADYSNIADTNDKILQFSKRLSEGNLGCIKKGEKRDE